MNKRRLEIIEPAEIELDDAYEYYEYEIEGLGKNFLDEFKKGISRIVLHPLAWSRIQENIRKCVLKKFPYNIIYAIDDDAIIILAVSHQHRHPEYWIDRLKDI